MKKQLFTIAFFAIILQQSALAQCSDIPTLACGAPTSVTLSGFGAWYMSGTFPNNTCGFSTMGQEKIYSFTPTTTGVHSLQVTSTTGLYFDYFYKAASGGCNNTGWTCIDDISEATTVPIGTLIAGVQYYILVDAEPVGSNTHTFQINCPAPSCVAAPTSPTNGQVICASATTTLSWPTVAGATSYDVHFGTSNPPPYVANTTNTTYAASTSTQETYYWQVSPKNVVGSASDCTVWSFSVANTVVYVNANATGANNGTSWTNAFTDLQNALNSTCPGVTEIWVAAGTYKPDQGAGYTPGDRSHAFVMKNNLAIYGGFPNTGNPGWDDRDWAANVTILSGEIGNPGNGNNSYHVISNDNNGLNHTAVLDGFTITGGNADSDPNIFGAGMYNSSSDPSVINCIFSYNSAIAGGGMYSVSSAPSVTNCTFSGNSAESGGGMYNSNSSPIVTNCVFSGNSAATSGGGMRSDDFSSSPTLTNCTFSGNLAAAGGGMYNLSSPILKNCIFWSNSSGIINYSGANLSVNHSIVQGGFSPCNNCPGGNGNIDPLFVNAAAGDFSLQACSPAINTGNNAAVPGGITSDLDGNTRFFNNGTVDMGAYEFQGSPTTTITCYQDSDGDTYGNAAVSQVFCGTCGTGYVSNNTDCDDTNPAINPGAAEICNNGLDDNCNGVFDEPSACPYQYTFTADGCNQSFTIPADGDYSFTVRGADGGDGAISARGGSGAGVTATFALLAGDVLTLVPGVAGQTNNGGGGGGGSALIRNSGMAQTLLMVAGGGGGAGFNYVNLSPTNGLGGIGNDGTPAGGGTGFIYGGGGGGFNAAGQGNGGGAAGTLNGGGNGGGGVTSLGGDGGFGFGGGGESSQTGGGGGGGYGGGNGGNGINANLPAGGGSSFVHASGTNVIRVNGITGSGTGQNGFIQITANQILAGVLIKESSCATHVTEGGATDTYTVQLTAQPTAPVSIILIGSTQVTANPTTLTFTSNSWDVPQTVTVTAVDDILIEGNHTGMITHTATSSDANYNDISIRSITANVTDNDFCPTLTAGSAASYSICSGDGSSITVNTTNQHIHIRLVYFTSPQTGMAMYSGGTALGASTAPMGASAPFAATFSNLSFPANNSSDPVTYYVYGIADLSQPEDCRPFVQFQVTVNPLPAAGVIAGTTTPMCPGQNAVFNLTGTPNAEVTYAINSGGNQTANLNAGGTAVVTITGATATQILTLVSVKNTTTNCMQSLSGNAVVFIEDVSPPSFTCPANRDVHLNTSCALVVPNLIADLTGSDNCGAVSFMQSPTANTAVSSAHNGTVTVIITANDGNGNSSNCQVTLTGKDVTPPTISCPVTQTLVLGANCTAILPNYISLATTGDNCGIQSVTQSPEAGISVSGVGDMSVTLTVTDLNGNDTECTFTVTKVDQTPPTIACPGTQTLVLGANCTAILPDYTSLAITGDNCGVQSVTQLPISGTLVSNAGNMAVTLTVTDVNGNDTECTFTVTKVDQTPPTITCPGTQTLVLGANCTASLPNYTSLATTGDNCGVQGVTQSPVAGTPVSGAGNMTVTLTVTDVNGNPTQCTFTVTKVDQTPPTIACPGTQTLVLGANCTATLPNYTSLATTGDNCGVMGVTQSPAAGTLVSGAGNITVMLTVTDVNGNPTECTFTVTKVDQTPPTITCPGMQTLVLGANCTATLPNYTSLATTGDNCGVQSVMQLPISGTLVSNSGNMAVTLTVTDVNGNETECTFTVTKVDQTPPTITCPGTQTLVLGANCTASLPNCTSLATTGDNCGVQGVTQSPVAGTPVSGAGNMTVTLTVTDVNGNPTECTFTATKVDQTPPIITCPGTQTLVLGANCTANLPNYTSLATTGDNCGVMGVTQSPAAGTTVSNTGNMTVTLTVTDVNGNPTQCTFTVTKVDQTPPTLVCREASVQLQGSQYALTPADVLNVAASSDNCGQVQVIDISPAQVGCDDIGQTLQVQVTATDGNGNDASCTAAILINKDSALPPGWTAANVGTTAAGSSSYDYCDNPGEFTLSANGYTTNTTDVQHSVYQSLCGNGELVAHVSGISPQGGWAGIQMRESTSQGSKKFTIKTQLNTILRREARSATFGATNTLQMAVPPSHTWLRITRAGNVFNAYSSADGLSWTFRGTATIAINSCLQVGLFVESINNATTTEAVIDNVFISGGNMQLVEAPLPNNAPEMEMLHEFSLYPNPTTGEINIDLTQYTGLPVRLEVYSLEGQLLQFAEIAEVQNMERLDLSAYENGMYLIKVKSEGLPVVTKRVVLAKK